MLLAFDDYLKVHVQITSEADIVSQHTGKLLSTVQVVTTVIGKDANDEFLNLIEKAKENNVSSVDDNGKLIKTWKVKNTSWSYRDGRPVYQHTLELEEVEELKLDYLDIDGFIVTPYDYQEKIDSEGISIESKVVLSEEQHNQLKFMSKTNDTFSVWRFGINETPAKMRFGLAYWSKHENSYKHEIHLIEHKEDKISNKIASAFQWMKNMRSFVAENQTTIDRLLDVLVAKNILTMEDVEKIRREVIEDSWEISYEFFKVDDIDKI